MQTREYLCNFTFLMNINMKHKYFLPLLALAMPALMNAVPANPRLRTITNPDGSEIQVRVHGDEHFHFMTDADGSRILERDSRGFVVDAVRNGMSLSLNSQNINMLRQEAIAQSPFPAETRSGATMQKMALLDSEGRSSYPTIGKGNRSLVVLVEFQDTPFTVDNPKEYYTRMLNEPGFSDYGGYGSALDYYIDASHGLYVPQFDVYGPVKISKNANAFKGSSSSAMATLISESLTQLHEAGEIDFSNYDLDNDGTVDTVFFFYAGYGAADSDTETIWPHQYNYQYYVNYGAGSMLRFDDKVIGPYACGNELAGYNPETKKDPWKDGSEPWVDGIGTFVHEYGHVLGLPDLYDAVSNSSSVVTPGYWDVMDVGSYNFNGCRPPLFSAYEQWVCRWLEFVDVEDGNSYELPALGSSDTPTAARIRIPVSDSGSSFQPEYFIIEARDNSSWDSCFPKSGLMVWRINYNKNNWMNNTVNTQNGSNVEIVYANGKNNPVFSSGAIYPGGNVELKPSKDYPLWESPTISGIRYNADSKVGAFDYNKASSSDLVTVLHENPFAASDGTNAFELVWDPVSGADSYLLTVRTAASKRIVSDFDAKDVGNVTSMLVSGISNTYWKLEMEAFVTCVADGMPASSSSNVITFKPTELQRGSENAVDTIIGNEVEISGGIGCINAPDSAQVFDLSGRPQPKSGLTPGIYLVLHASRSHKVIVK